MARLRVFISSVQKELAEERMAIQILLSTDSFLQRHSVPRLFEYTPAPLTPNKKGYLDLLGTGRGGPAGTAGGRPVAPLCARWCAGRVIYRQSIDSSAAIYRVAPATSAALSQTECGCPCRRAETSGGNRQVIVRSIPGLRQVPSANRPTIVRSTARNRPICRCRSKGT